ncbi:hypothetical protein SEUCBS139899_001271 [Sporothrix eucalyptigena]
MMYAAVDAGNAASQPMLIYVNPQCWHDATETRQDPSIVTGHAAKIIMAVTTVTAVPRLRQCHGWTTLRVAGLPRHGMPLWPPPMQIERRLTRELDDTDPDAEYYAIIYEYIGSADSERLSLNIFAGLSGDRA